jgi:hypothetical protein
MRPKEHAAKLLEIERMISECWRASDLTHEVLLEARHRGSNPVEAKLELDRLTEQRVALEQMRARLIGMMDRKQVLRPTGT